MDGLVGGAGAACVLACYLGASVDDERGTGKKQVCEAKKHEEVEDVRG